MTTDIEKYIKKSRQIFKGTVLWKEHESFLREALSKVREEVQQSERKRIGNEIEENAYYSPDEEAYIIPKSMLLEALRREE